MNINLMLEVIVRLTTPLYSGSGVLRPERLAQARARYAGSLDSVAALAERASELFRASGDAEEIARYDAMGEEPFRVVGETGSSLAFGPDLDGLSWEVSEDGSVMFSLVVPRSGPADWRPGRLKVLCLHCQHSPFEPPRTEELHPDQEAWFSAVEQLAWVESEQMEMIRSVLSRLGAELDSQNELMLSEHFRAVVTPEG